MAIEPGDLFWEGPRRNTAKTAPLDGDGRIPHSEALPALARLLASGTDLRATLVRSLALVDVTAMADETPALVASDRGVLMALIAALEPTP